MPTPPRRRAHPWSRIPSGAAAAATNAEVKVAHCSLCGSDVHLWRADGDYKDFTGWAAGQKVQICGHEAVGEVTAVEERGHAPEGRPALRRGLAVRLVPQLRVLPARRRAALPGGQRRGLHVRRRQRRRVRRLLAHQGRGLRLRAARRVGRGGDGAAALRGQTVADAAAPADEGGDRVGVWGWAASAPWPSPSRRSSGCEVTALSSSDSKKRAALDLERDEIRRARRRGADGRRRAPSTSSW